MSSTLNLLPLDKIRIDGGTQSRVTMNQATIAAYAEAMTEGDAFPKLLVYFDGADFWLADGFHRYHACRSIGAVDVDCEVVTGSLDEAILRSLGVNALHGLPPTNADKRKGVMTCLASSTWAKWSDTTISEKCGVSRRFVGSVRSSLGTVPSEKPTKRTFVNKHGTESVMNTGGIAEANKQRAEQAGESGADPEPDHVRDKRLAAQHADADMAAAMPTQEELLVEVEQERQAAVLKVAELEAAMAADANKAQLLIAIKRADHAIRRQNELMEDAASSRKRADFYERQLGRCGKAVGIRDLDKVASAVEALARATKVLE